MPRKATKASGTGTRQRPAAAESAEETIRQRAYELHLERGGAHGRDMDDWLEAERQVQARQQPAATRSKRKK